MNSKIILVNIFRWFLLLFIQIILLRNLSFYSLATPFVYVLFLLLLPFKIPNLLLYLIAFVTGLTLDAFYDTMGVHTARLRDTDICQDFIYCRNGKQR
jgi:rod shape-determining protein MreD